MIILKLKVMHFIERLFCLFLILLFIPIFSFAVNGEDRIIDKVTGIDSNGNIETIALKKPKVILSKTEIFHYEILNVYLYNLNNIKLDQLHIRVYKREKTSASMGKIYNVPFLREGDRLRASWLPDWNAEDGDYEIRIYYKDRKLKTNKNITFKIKRRVPPKIDDLISVVDLELNSSLKNKSLITPSSSYSDYLAVLDWTKFMNADALWILSGETTSFRESKEKIGPWDKGPLENLHLLKEHAPESGIKIGAYIMAFYVPGDNGVTNRYKAGIGYDSKKDLLYFSKHISLKSENRIEDIIELARSFQDDPKINFIGFDFIRTGRADGYELAEEVIKETNIKTPGYWNHLSREEKIKWFAKKIEVENDQIIIEKWRWLRAHKVAIITKRIIEESKITKPVWVYTLGWDHGREHGQDPIMFFDAGVDIDAVMLYEANEAQFESLIIQWNNYIKKGQGNIFIGNCVDYKLLDSKTLSPPGELYSVNRQV